MTIGQSVGHKTLSEISEKYNLELDRIIENIKKEKWKASSAKAEGYRVLLQFPEGMKPYSQAICDYISEKACCECFIWLDSCFGACDVPLEVEKLRIGLIVQFGHSAWKFPSEKKIRVLK